MQNRVDYGTDYHKKYPIFLNLLTFVFIGILIIFIYFWRETYPYTVGAIIISSLVLLGIYFYQLYFIGKNISRSEVWKSLLIPIILGLIWPIYLLVDRSIEGKNTSDPWDELWFIGAYLFGILALIICLIAQTIFNTIYILKSGKVTLGFRASFYVLLIGLLAVLPLLWNLRN